MNMLRAAHAGCPEDEPSRRNRPNIHGVISLTALSPSPRRPQLAGQIGQRQQARRGERAAAGRDHHERIGGRDIGPPCWQREQLPVLVMQVDPVLAPVLPVGDELEVPAIQRVERVRHPDPSVPIVRIRCS